MNLALEGCTFCICHGGSTQRNAQKKQHESNYRLTKWQARLEQKASATGIKSLRDEVGILRMLLEEQLNKCEDTTDLLIHSGRISDLAMKLEKLVASCHKLEGSMGDLLDKTAILQFASEIVESVSDELKGDEKKINAIANKIMAAVGRIGTKDDE